MAKIVKRNLDSARRAPVRKKSYEAPAVRSKKKRDVPKEYQTLNKAPRHHNGFLWLLFLAFIAAVAGFFYWSQQNTVVVDNSMEMKVVGPEKIVSGDQATYNIEYKNIDTVDLQDMKLTVRWPAGFYFDESSVDPSDDGATTWDLPDLSPGQTANLEIKGVLVGPKDENISATFSLHYQPANFHSDFKAKQTIETKISENKLEVVVEALDKTLVSTTQEFKLIFRNLSKDTLEDLSMDVLYPDDWVPAILDGDLEEIIEGDEIIEEDVVDLGDFINDGRYWQFSLDPQEEKSMTVFGTFPADSASEQSLVVEVGNLVEEKFRRLARAEKTFVVVNPQFEVKLKINGKEGDQNVKWDEALRYQLEITNKSETEIADVKVTAFVEGDSLDWDSLDTIGNYEENIIVWTQQEDESLATWPVEETKLFTWELKIVDEPVPQRLIENIVKLNIEGLGDWEQVTSPVMLTVGESLAFNNGVYWDLGGRQVGSGYLPPQVGQETQYLVVWSITQATGYFDNVATEVTLPPQVSFIEETDTTDGELVFDEDTKTLTWNIENFDDLILPSTASFVISLEPDESSRGQAMTLINPVTVKALGLEEIIVETKIIKTSDVIADTSETIGIIE